MTKRELQFSKEATPDVPIALAARASASISIVFAPVAVAGGSMVDGGTCNNMPANDLTALDSLSGASIVRVPNGYASSFDRHMPVATRQRLYGDG
ncbi:patatin-like phospholipase family protein [Burkholderia ubonensis]|uniref:patatin-like phospholipase family protein n=1 Tax=Burkholderia ubonensis TaxID=101571 RepID=UPI0022B76C08|nr:patatin-like phospholipase family protein [Burkholderia ubonensis]